MEIIHRNNANDGIFIAKDGEVEKGYIQYDWIDEKMLAVMHTVVVPAYRGQGVAKELLDTVAAFARDNQYRIRPICSYAVKMFAHGGYEDVAE